MSFRPKPKTIQLMVKTHKTTVIFPTEREDKFEDIKKRVLSALTQFNAEQDVPPIKSTDDFELCVGRKIPGKGLTFEIIDPNKRVNEVYMSKPWEYAFIKFRHPETLELLPIRVKFAEIDEENTIEPI